ncbi:MAG: NAD(P)-dependent oxidoreductase [Eubacterium sp.]|nr:NAD(P)-dependent oxidoreductase [Eubacterium sp.]
MKRVVITGATGAIGRALIDECIKNEYEVLAVVHRSSGRVEELTELDHCQVLHLDLAEYGNAVEEMKGQGFPIEGYSMFFHLAWAASFGADRNDLTLQLSNVQAAVDAVSFAHQIGCSTFVGAGSQAEYGRVGFMEIGKAQDDRFERNEQKTGFVPDASMSLQEDKKHRPDTPMTLQENLKHRQDTSVNLCEDLGFCPDTPVSLREDLKLRPDTPTNPETGYGIAKLCAGQMTRLAAEKYGMKHIWTRVLSVYGPHDRAETLISTAVSRMLRNEETEFSPCGQIWDYLYEEDAARALLLAGEKGIHGKNYVVGSGEAHPLRWYVEKIAEITGYRKEIGFGRRPYNDKQVMHLVADISELEGDIGFRPKVDFEAGIWKMLSMY